MFYIAGSSSCISVGILSLSIAFIDKLNLDLSNPKNKRVYKMIWISLISAFAFAMITSISIYIDAEDSAATELIRSKYTKTLFFITMIMFCLEIFCLVRLGFIIIQATVKQ